MANLPNVTLLLAIGAEHNARTGHDSTGHSLACEVCIYLKRAWREIEGAVQAAEQDLIEEAEREAAR